MKLIVGLGNPGSTYRDSRHNIGFSVIKEIAKAEKIVLKKDINVVSGKGKIEGQNIILAMPLTFMNLSGAAVTSLFKKYKIELDS
jgi:PTH1 family peptidyl-tRNA hydrolase